MYSPVSLLAIALISRTTHALAPPTPADLASPASLTSSNLTSTPGSATIGRLQNITQDPADDFLGVHCYHLPLPSDTVNLELCQPLFARLLRDGNVYEERGWWNGWLFRRPGEPCTVALSSPERRDLRVRISLAEVVVFAMEVLQTCSENGVGGANTFQGEWRVVVTRNPLASASTLS